MRPYSLLIVLIFITITISAQNRLTIEDAITLAFENNIELKKQTAEIKSSEINIEESARLPNPLLSYSREDLASGNLTYNEWTATFTIPINFIWNRWSGIKSKEEAKKVEQFLYERLKSKIAADVRTEYYSYYLYSKLSEEFNDFLKQLDDIAEVSSYRLNEGDISDYEHRRILFELNKIKLIVTEVELKRNNYYNNLSLLIGMNERREVKLVTSDDSLTFNYELDELITIALEKRNDLRAYKAMIESEESALLNNRMKLIPELSLTAGYKKQADNFSGRVIQLNIAVPLFERNQTGIEKSEIKLDIIEKEFSFLKEKIKLEVSEAFNRFKLKKNIYYSMKESKLESTFSTAAYAYDQGEITLLEFIDGINVYAGGLINKTDLEIEVYTSLFRLEAGVDKELIKLGK